MMRDNDNKEEICDLRKEIVFVFLEVQSGTIVVLNSKKARWLKMVCG